MPSISETLASLSGSPFNGLQGSTGRQSPLVELHNFGTNPGKLIARTFVPAGLPAGAPLVVVLHGCTQNAAIYDRGSGWSQLAAEQGFALLYPEQQRSNNANMCFNWFERGDISRGAGEVQSIQQMVLKMIEQEGLAADRVYVTGLSAGGAMTAAMLATYPELFAGGAVIAGLPYGSAAGVSDALTTMRAGDRRSATDLAASVRSASPYGGRRPAVSIWHGTADHTVSPANGRAAMIQWRSLLDLPEAPTSTAVIDRHRRSAWEDASGAEVLEFWEIEGMDHGTPIAVTGADACGSAQPHMLAVGISSTRHIARFWGLHASAVRTDDTPSRQTIDAPSKTVGRISPTTSSPAASSIGSIIEDALRKAGLMP